MGKTKQKRRQSNMFYDWDDMMILAGTLFLAKLEDVSCNPGEYPVITARLAVADRLICDNIIKKVVFNDPATIVMWADGTKTVVKCQPGDEYSKEHGLAMCMAKKMFGNKGHYNEVFKHWLGDTDEDNFSGQEH